MARSAIRIWTGTHNLVLIGRPSLLAALDLGVNQDIKSRVTYSAITKRLGPEAMKEFLLRELDRAGLGHNTFSPVDIDLVNRVLMQPHWQKDADLTDY